MADRAPPLALAAAAAFLWGTLGVAYRLGEALGASLDWLIAGRPLLAGAAAAVLAAAVYREPPGRWSAAIALLGLAPLYTVYPLAVSQAGAAVASVLLYTAPAWVVVAAWLLLGEHPGARGLAAVPLGILGAALVSGALQGGASVTPLGAALGLASGASYAAYMVLARIAGLRGAGPAQVALYPIALSAPVVLLAVRPEGRPGAVEAAFILYLAVACTLLPYFLHTRALARAEAGRVAVVSLIEPLTAVALARLLLGEDLTAAQMLGAVLILASAWLATSGRG